VAENLLQREFTAERPNQRWVGDTTELRTPQGKLYLAVILDLFSRFVVGWALSAVNDRHVTMKALDMALRRRCPPKRGPWLAPGATNATRAGAGVPPNRPHVPSTLCGAPSLAALASVGVVTDNNRPQEVTKRVP
jgi:transposase InsO family protein